MCAQHSSIQWMTAPMLRQHKKITLYHVFISSWLCRRHSHPKPNHIHQYFYHFISLCHLLARTRIRARRAFIIVSRVDSTAQINARVAEKTKGRKKHESRWNEIDDTKMCGAFRSSIHSFLTHTADIRTYVCALSAWDVLQWRHSHNDRQNNNNATTTVWTISQFIYELRRNV